MLLKSRFFILFVFFYSLSGLIALELKAQIGTHWQKFKTTHGKKYSGEEEEIRKEIFKKNVEAVLRHNLQFDMGETTFSQGINQFSDMSHEEFGRIMCSAVPTRNNVTVEEFVSAERATVPEKVDWRDKHIVGPVKNQLNYAAGWAFASTAAIESSWAKAKGKLVLLSEQEMVDCFRYGGGLYGEFPDFAMESVIKNGGLSKMSCYPYKGREGDCQEKKSCRGATISKCVNVKRGDENLLKEAVATVGPVAVSIDAEQPDFQHYKTGIYNPPYCSQQVNHSVLVIGYGTEGGKDYWLLKNSWGTSWGEKGYFKLMRHKHACGITQNPAYPVV